MKIRVGDTVKVLYGKNAGENGVVSRVFRKQSKVLVDGLNVFKRHIKGDGQSRKSEIVLLTKPIAVSKVQLVDPTSGKGSRVGYQVIDGKKVRIAKKSGKAIQTVSAKSKKEEVVEEKNAKPAKKKESK